jgi:hypothetical protein
MANKRGIRSNISESDAKGLTKKSSKQIGKDMGGNPDATDEKWIQIWIDMYDKAYPGRIRKMINDVAVEIALSDIKKHSVVSEDSEMRRAFWLPAELAEVLEASYPSFWTNQKHIRWFCRHFPQFAFDTYTKATKT